MAKIQNDKYYTSKEIAKYCVEKTQEIIGGDNISEFVEPSAGGGVFLDYLTKPYIAYDICPEDSRIVKQDYLSCDLLYKKGRCIIGNPPYGDKNTLAVRFFKKSVRISDYVAFVLPISQLANNQQMYEFDLVSSEDLGERQYSGRKLHCCFNVYKRPKDGILNKRTSYKLRDVVITERRRGGKCPCNCDYDIGICSFGIGCIGKIPEHAGQYAKEFYFTIYNDQLRDKIIGLIKNTDWQKDVCKGISGQANLAQWQVYKYIKEQIPEIN